MRILVACLDSPGFLYPMIGLASELQARGHQVAFATDVAARDLLHQSGHRRITRGESDGRSFRIDRWFVDIAGALQVKHVEYAVETFCPDVLVTHVLALGPLVAARRTSIPVGVMGMAAYLWPSDQKQLDRVSDEYASRLTWRYEEMTERLNDVRTLFGMASHPVSLSYGENPLLGDVFFLRSVPEVEGNVDLLPDTVHFVGSCTWLPPAPPCNSLLAWINAQPTNRPLLYVQPGRSFDEASLWVTLEQVLALENVRVVMDIGRSDYCTGPFPEWTYVDRHIPFQHVLPHADAVVSSGHSTVALGTALHGLPSLLCPSGSGSGDIAERYELAGSAVRLPLEAVNRETMRSSIHHVLHNPSIQERAHAIQATFQRYDGFSSIANGLLSLVPASA